jgi:acyl-CoA synthetase (AMP-forming)/AMP-acid ligase II
MIFRSPFPDVMIPETPLTPFVLRHAERLADKPAVIDAASGRSITYREVASGVRRTAAGLAERGLRKGAVFAIYAPNLPDYAVVALAVASLGGVVTMVSHLATAEEVSRQLVDAGATYLLTTPELLERARTAAEGTGVREVFAFGEASEALPIASLPHAIASPPDVAIAPETDVVVLPYSSGTTGLPKGVAITHRNLVANVCQVNVPHRLAETDVVFGQPPFFHIYGLFLVAFVLAGGATLVTLPRFELAAFLRAVQEHRVTRAYLVPPVALALANNPIVDEFDLSTLKAISSGAAPLGADVARRCERRLGCHVVQGYGMTEASPTTHLVPIATGPSKPGSVGVCVPNTETRVTDLLTGAELGPDQQGEVWVRGPQVMTGYLNRPEATTQAITADGWLRTGDLGFVDGDGSLYVVDRLKELIKYNAYQVAPAELEAVLLSHPAVADAAVIPFPDEAAGEVPKAFVVLKGEATADELLAFVAARVAPYKKVRRLEFVDQVPKSPSGKVLRRVLVERERAASRHPV